MVILDQNKSNNPILLLDEVGIVNGAIALIEKILNAILTKLIFLPAKSY